MNTLKHVAIIMDGNGRWGIKHKNSRNAGHKAGLKTVENIIKETINGAKSSISNPEIQKNKAPDTEVENKSKTIQELDREKLNVKFSNNEKEKLN